MVSPSPVARSAVSVSAGSLLALLSSAAVSILASSLFGASQVTDAYLIALAIPAVISAIASVAPANASVPVLVQTRVSDGDEAADRATGFLLSASVLLMLMLGGVVLVVREAIVDLVAPGFTTETRTLTASLLWLTVPATVMASAAAAIGSALNARGRFYATAFAPALTNVVVLLSLATLGSSGVFAWGAGYLGGALSSLALVTTASWRTGQRPRPTLDWTNRWAQGLMLTAGPFIGLAVVVQSSGLVVRQITTLLDPGTVTALALALTITAIPLNVAGYSVGTALVPAFAALAGSTGRHFAALYSRSVVTLAVMLMPAALMLGLCAENIVRLMFERGAFTERATLLTADALRIYGLSLLFEPILVVSHRALLGTRATKTLLSVGSAQALTLVALCLLLAGPFGHAGVAAGYTIAVAANAAALALVVRGRLALPMRGLLRAYSGVGLAAALGLGGGRLVSMLVSSDVATIVLTGLIGGAIYFGLLMVAQRPALSDLVRLLPRRLSGPLSDKIHTGTG